MDAPIGSGSPTRVFNEEPNKKGDPIWVALFICLVGFDQVVLDQTTELFAIVSVQSFVDATIVGVQ